MPPLEAAGASWTSQFEIHSAKGQYAETSSQGLSAEMSLRLSVAIQSHLCTKYGEMSQSNFLPFMKKTWYLVHSCGISIHSLHTCHQPIFILLLSLFHTVIVLLKSVAKRGVYSASVPSKYLLMKIFLKTFSLSLFTRQRNFFHFFDPEAPPYF